MNRLLLVVSALLLSFVVHPVEASERKRDKARQQVLDRGRGYYKEIFMDSGIALTSRTYLPSARYLGLDVEYFASASQKKLTQKDTLLQSNIFCGSEEDTNGWLLYPDGAPRFRMIYVNGGSALKHARSLGDLGRERVREFVAAGGSYFGTCAGAYLGARGGKNSKGYRNVDKYFGLWSGYGYSTGLKKQSTTLNLERGCPLLRYFDFGKDNAVDDVRHNGGCYACELPVGTEPLARYKFNNTDKVKIDGELCIWAYKPMQSVGRAVLCGSHPEAIAEGERLKLTAAMLLYAMDGNPEPRIKGVLENGVVREMNKRTEDNDPDYTRIGDLQYHHFAVDVPRGCKSLKITLNGYEEAKKFDLTLLAKRGELAFHDNTTEKVVSRGCKKSLTINNPKPGRWYISVRCETTVTTGTNKYGTYYRSYRSVLNGVPYKVAVSY
ncbi:MAG: hypothetical protein E7139_04445 [Rikenellaceae bacterium]|nr:hypothetical protein [Rikenellaceae bacterium]